MMMTETANNESQITPNLESNDKNYSIISKKKGEECESNVVEENDDETDLTNLTWLTELRNQNLTFANTLSIPTEDDYKCCIQKIKIPSISNICNNSKAKQMKTTSKLSTAVTKNLNQQMQAPLKRATPADRYKIFLDKIKRDLSEYQQCAVSYQTDPAEKPPFNYSHIIGMAMLENGRVTLQQICTWIEEKFAFFRTRKKWNNSIRHNLSLHYCFRKIDRNKFEKGKGGYWELGVDPKKCDRKRIRNRRTNRNKIVNVGNKFTDHDQKRKLSTTSESHPKEIEMSVLEKPTNMPQLQEGFLLECSINQQSVSMADVFPQPTVENESQCQQFHLGTIIINAAEADISSTSLSLLGSTHDWSLQYHNFSGRENINSQTHGNIILPSRVLDKTEIEDPHPSTTSLKNYCNTSQNQDMFKRQFNIVPGSSLLRPNVIVEQVLQPQNCTLSTIENILPLPVNYVTENNENVVNSVNDNFRPYIDGIEEAFQYLRSIDQNNREDILDNILDISVSDY